MSENAVDLEALGYEPGYLRRIMQQPVIGRTATSTAVDGRTLSLRRIEATSGLEAPLESEEVFD